MERRIPHHDQGPLIRTPADEDNLVPRALPALKLILEIIDRIPRPLPLPPLGRALRVQQLRAERIPIAAGGCALDLDLAVVVRELEDDVFEFLLELELVVGGDALGGDGDAVRGEGRVCVSGMQSFMNPLLSRCVELEGLSCAVLWVYWRDGDLP